jgi:rare lipoprotein A
VRALDPVNYQAQQNLLRDRVALQNNPNLYLQIGAFSNAENAERLRSRLGNMARGNVRIVRAELDQRTIYRVRIGPIADVEEADRMSRELVVLGLDDPRIVID